MSESTKFTQLLTINAPGKNVTVDGIDFTENGYVEVKAAKSVTIKNCRIYGIIGSAAKEAWMATATGENVKVTMTGCFFGNNLVESGNKLSVAQLNGLISGSSVSSNYVKLSAATEAAFQIGEAADNSIIKFDNNEFEGYNGYVLNLTGSPKVNYSFAGNAILGRSEIIDMKTAGLVCINITKDTVDLSGVNISVPNLEMPENLLYPVYGEVSDDATVTAEQIPDVKVNGESQDTVYWDEQGEASDIGGPDKDPSHVAKIGDVWYASLPDAIAAAPDGVDTTIVLKKDVEAGAGIATWEAHPKFITIDFEGHTYEMTHPAVGSTGTTTQAIHFERGSKITLKNGNFVVGEAQENVKMLMQNYCDLRIENMVIDTLHVTLSIYSFPETSPYYEEWNGKSVPIFNYNNGTSEIADSIIVFQAADTNGIYVAKGDTAYPDGAHLTISGSSNVNGPLTPEENDRLVITGGVFKADPTAFVDQTKCTITKNADNLYIVEKKFPYTIDWYGSYVPADTKIGRTTTGRVAISEYGTPLPNKAAYTAQLPDWELVYDPEYLQVKTEPTAAPSYINFVLTALKAGETTIQYRNKANPTVQAIKAVRIDHNLVLSITPSGTHMVESGPVEISASTTLDGEPVDFEKITFSSSDESIATIDGRTITPVKGGKITVTAQSKEDPAIQATATVTFVEAAAKINDTYYDTITNALKAVASGETVVLQRDVTESVIFSGQTPRVEGFVLNIDLAGHTWNGEANDSYTLRTEYGIVTIKDSVGGGAMNYGKDYVFIISHLAAEYVSKLILADNITYTGKTSVAQAGTAGGTGSNKKYYGGELEILGGMFITVPDTGETYDDQGNFKYSLNMLDMNESAYPGGIYSPSKITVMGGTFKQFNPANCLAEGPNTNFVAEGKTSTNNGDGTWTVA